MIYESKDEEYSWGHQGEWLLNVFCRGNKTLFQLVRDGFLEVIELTEKRLEDLFPGADFITEFDFGYRNELRIWVGSYEYFERLWGVRIHEKDDVGRVLNDDLPKLADKQKLMELIGGYDAESAYICYVALQDIPGIPGVIKAYTEKLKPYGVRVSLRFGVTLALERVEE